MCIISMPAIGTKVLIFSKQNANIWISILSIMVIIFCLFCPVRHLYSFQDLLGIMFFSGQGTFWL